MTLRGNEQKLLGLLAAGRSVKDAAAGADVSERTVYRRLGNPGFQARLTAVRDELLAAALGELVGCANQAVTKLRALLDADDERVQLQAAKALLDQALRLREAVRLEQRLAAVERNVELARKKGRR